MKKCLLLLSLLIVQFTARGQAIPNADFENWSNFNYDEPALWFSSNIETVPAFSIPTVSPVVGFSGLAARIETYIIGLDTLKGAMANTIQDILAGQGGVPYSDQPTDITGYYRYDLPANDTALLLVIFKNSGAVISFNLFKIKGTGSEPNYIPFSFPLTLATAPDTVIIAATASNLITNQGIENGSWIEWDELAFSGPSVTQAIPNGTMDNWINKSIDNPLGWTNFGDGVKQSSDAYTGLSALSLENTDPGTGVQISGITSGTAPNEGGYPFTNANDTLVGFYKYLSPGNDTGMGTVTTSLNGSSVGGGIIYFPPASVYTPFAIPIVSAMSPDTMRIEFFSSYFPFDSAIVGSKLYIDNLDLQSIITGVNHLNHNNSLFSAYPNPVNDKLHVGFDGSVQELQVFLYNALGENVYEYKSSDKSFDLNTSQLPAGCYWLKMISGNNVSVRKMVRQ